MVRVAGSNPVFRSDPGPEAARPAPARWRHGRVVRQGSAKPCTPVRFRVSPLGEGHARAISSGGERFLDAEEVSGSNPLSPTTWGGLDRRALSNYLALHRFSARTQDHSRREVPTWLPLRYPTETNSRLGPATAPATWPRGSARACFATRWWP